jgi:serine/threonine-protein kinase RsbW
MHKHIKIESRIGNLSIVEKTIEEVIFEVGITHVNYGKILVSTLEAVNNAIQHGNSGCPEKVVEIKIESKDNELKIKVSDEGTGFHPERIPDPTKPENIESQNGRGVFLMSRLADKVEYNKKGNIVTLTFKNILS